MARTDVMVLGAGIVGTSTALQFAKRGLSVALVDRRDPGEETSYGNAGVIGGAGVYPMAFPNDVGTLLRIAFKRSPLANYHLAFLPKVVPWLLAFRAASKPEKLVETSRIMRPLLARALGEHEVLLRESGAERYLHKDGWISIYRSDRALAALEPELELGAMLGVRARTLDVEAARARAEPPSGIPPRDPLARHRQRVGPPRRHPRLCGAVCRARRRRGERRCALAASRGWKLAGGNRRRAGRCLPGGDRTGPLGAGRARAARHSPAACGQARLSPPIPAARQRRIDAAGGRPRERLCAGADAAGHPAHDRRRVRRPRCVADPGAA